MGAVPHNFTERNTVQTNNSATYASVTGIAQASGSFTVGEKYLVIATAQCGGASVNARTNIHVIHGSTEFEGSLATIQMLDGTQKETYSFMTVWTAVSSEGLDIEFRGDPITFDNNTVNFVSLLSIQLSSVLTENTDWFFNESTADQQLTTGFNQYDGGSVTFTPGTASHNWLVLAHASYTRTTTGASVETRINRDAGTSLTPLSVFVPSNAAAISTATLARVFNLPASSTTIKEQSMCGNGAIVTRTYSCILAIDLDKFAAYGQAYTDADFTYTATAIATPDQLQTCSITPTQASDVWILGYHGFDKAVVSYSNQFRIQVDNSDQPSGQTTAAYVFNAGHGSNSAVDEEPRLLSTMVSSMSAAAHTIDLDGAVSNTTSSPSAQQRQLVAIQLTTASSNHGLMLMGVGGMVRAAALMNARAPLTRRGFFKTLAALIFPVKTVVLALAMLLAWALLAHAYWTKTVSWNPNTEPDLAGYKIYRDNGVCAIGPLQPLMINGVPASTTQNFFVDTTVPSGTMDLCYEITAYDTSGNESAHSTRATVTVSLIRYFQPVLNMRRF